MSYNYIFHPSLSLKTLVILLLALGVTSWCGSVLLGQEPAPSGQPEQGLETNNNQDGDVQNSAATDGPPNLQDRGRCTIDIYEAKDFSPELFEEMYLLKKPVLIRTSNPPNQLVSLLFNILLIRTSF
jgi:hypothetical protein